MKIIGISARYVNDQVVDYQDTMRIVLGEVADFWRTVSYGQLQVTADAAPTYVIPRDRPAVSETSWIAEAQHAASVFGYTGSHPVVLVSGAGESRGNLGSSGMYVNTLDPKTIAHEIGHNLGLNHDGGFHVLSGADLTASGVNEYGDFTSVMGTADLDPGSLPMHARQRLGWSSGPLALARVNQAVVLGDISVGSVVVYYSIPRADGLQYTLERYGTSLRLRFSWNSMLLVRAFTINGYFSDPYGGLTFQQAGDSVQITVFEPTAVAPPPYVPPPDPPPTPPPVVLPPPPVIVLPPPPQPEEPKALLLGEGDRFELRAEWKTPDTGLPAAASAQRMTAKTGYFWFFNPDNVEIVVKVLDGRAVNGKFWVFYASLTNIEFMLSVYDTVSGLRKEYENPAGSMASKADTEAF